MDWKEILSVIGAVAGIFWGVMQYFKWGIDAKFKAIEKGQDNQKELLTVKFKAIEKGQDNQKELLTAKIKPIDDKLSNHVMCKTSRLQ